MSLPVSKLLMPYHVPKGREIDPYHPHIHGSFRNGEVFNILPCWFAFKILLAQAPGHTDEGSEDGLPASIAP